MRFFADGPNIPDELLEARDKGNVVFLCGAGVSLSAGMPTFQDLTNYVVKQLGTPLKADSRKMLSIWDDNERAEAARPSLDQIFNLLQQDYSASEIDYWIARRLKTKPGSCVSAHKTILRLSRGANGKPQIVTTNFDLLFQYADKRLPHYVPPALPDLASGQTLNGLVYLHGRINNRVRRGEARQGFVVSSSDFGRAYLAEGWATRFVRELLDRYTVILLGYSASDPPVRYLLQGLHSMGHSNRRTIFAFDKGDEDDVRTRWKDSGVRTLAYPATNDHSVLWDTLETWAQRADDPVAWRRGVVELARRGPRNLEKHERGQVASLVRSIDGAKLFAEADPPPPGEWLCVFDRSARYGKAKPQFFDSLPTFDPLTEYGLDDDPPRPRGNRPEAIPSGVDFLSLGATDPHKSYHLRLAGMPHQKDIPLPARLSQLAIWIAKIAHDPVAPWWAAKHSSLHPSLLIWIEQRIRQNGDDFPPLARSIWSLLLEKFRNVPDDKSYDSLYKVKQLIAAEGWTNGVLRELERSVTPYLKTESRPNHGLGRPPKKDWAELQLSNIAEFEVVFPYISDIESEIPDRVLPAAYAIGRRKLELGVEMLEDVNPSSQETLKFFLKNNVGAMRGNYPGVYLQWFRRLLNRMVETHPKLVRADMALWPEEDPYFFNGLRLYVWSFDTLFSGNEVGDGLLSLSDKAFWSTSHRRELLHLLRRRWQGLSTEKRKLLEDRIIGGRKKYEGESDENYNRWSPIQSARILGWLTIQGCDLSDDTKVVLPSLRSAHPDWRPEWDEDADDDGEGGGGLVTIDSDASILLNAPLSHVISLARDNTKRSYEDLTDYQPFDGLVKQRPSKAVDALTLAARQGEYPREYWQSLLENWPETANHPLIGLVGEILMELPSEVIERFRFHVFLWLKKNLPELAKHDQTLAFRIFDALLDKLLDGGEDATRSGIGGVRVAGDSQGWSRRTMDYAFNSAVGLAAQLLFDLLKSQNPEKGSGVPQVIKSRLECLIAAPGEGADHAVCLVSREVEWLHHLDPDWARSTIVPWFDPGHQYSEPAWNGFLYRSKLPAAEFFSLLRTYFLEVFSYAQNWKWNDQGLLVLHEFLVCGCLWRKHDEVYLTYPETLRALQLTDDSGRAHAISYLTDLIERNQVSWHQFGKPFLDKAWPRETSLKTEDTSLNLARLAGVTGDDFPEAVQTVLPYLAPIYGDSWFLYRVVSTVGEEEFDLTTQFPDATLTLINRLVPDSPPEPLFDLNFILEKIAEAKPSLRQDGRWLRLKGIARRE